MCFQRQFLAAAVAGSLAVCYASAQTTSKDSADALELLQKASQLYIDLKSYTITQEETFSSEHPPDPAPTTMTATEAPSHRYRFEADIGLGNDVRVSDGHFVWFYRPKQKSYTQTLADPAKGASLDTSKSLWPDEGGIVGASQLRELAQFVADYKSALKLSDASLILRGHWFECYVVELSNDDLNIPQPYPFTETVWVEKGSFKIRKVVENYITTLQRGGRAPITYPATRVITYPEVTLNEPIPDAAFQFTPPAGAHLVTEFSDRIDPSSSANTAGTKAQNIMLRSVDGQRVQLNSFRGHPVLIDLWATWCAPCIAGLRDVGRLHEELQETGLTILSIDVADDANAAQAYVVKMHYPWPNFHDHGEVDAAFGTEGVPRSILINADGEITLDRVSPTPDELRKEIAKLGPEYARALGAEH